MKYEAIEIVFENIESIIVPHSRVIAIDYSPLAKLKNASFEENSWKAEWLSMKIIYHDESELKYDPNQFDEPLGMYVQNNMSNRIADRPYILGRLMCYHDIVNLEFLNDQAGIIQTVYVPWDDAKYEENGYMRTEAKSGVLTIDIRAE